MKDAAKDSDESSNVLIPGLSTPVGANVDVPTHDNIEDVPMEEEVDAFKRNVTTSNGKDSVESMSNVLIPEPSTPDRANVDVPSYDNIEDVIMKAEVNTFTKSVSTSNLTVPLNSTPVAEKVNDSVVVEIDQHEGNAINEDSVSNLQPTVDLRQMDELEILYHCSTLRLKKGNNIFNKKQK